MTKEQYNKAVEIVREMSRIKGFIAWLDDGPDPIAEKYDFCPGDDEWYWKAKDNMISQAKLEIEHLMIEFASL